jgi:hypothetical protein
MSVIITRFPAGNPTSPNLGSLRRASGVYMDKSRKSCSITPCARPGLHESQVTSHQSLRTLTTLISEFWSSVGLRFFASIREPDY